MKKVQMKIGPNFFLHKILLKNNTNIFNSAIGVYVHTVQGFLDLYK